MVGRVLAGSIGSPPREMTFRWRCVALPLLLVALGTGGCFGSVSTTDEAHRPAAATSQGPETDPVVICPSAGWSSSDAVLASLDGDALMLTTAAGSTQSLSIDLGALEGQVDHNTLHHRGERLAVTATRIELAGDVNARTAVLVADRSGKVLWRRLLEGVDAKVSGLALDGRALVHLYSYQNGLWPVGYALLGPTAEPHYLTDFNPLEEPNEAGLVVGWESTPSGKRAGWWDTNSGELIEAEWASQAPWFVAHQGQLLSVLADSGAVWLVSESSDGTSTTAPLSSLPDDELPELMSHQLAGWLMLRRPSDGSFWQIDVNAGSATAVEPMWPAGGTFFAGGCETGTPLADTLGRVLLPWRDDSAAHLHLLDLNAATTLDLGAPLANILGIDVSEAGGSFLVRTADPSDSFCPSPEWSEPAPAAALQGRSLQLLRPDAAVAYQLPPSIGAAQLSSDGRCVLYQDDEQQQQILDVLSGAVHPLGHDRPSRWLR